MTPALRDMDSRRWIVLNTRDYNIDGVTQIDEVKKREVLQKILGS